MFDGQEYAQGVRPHDLGEVVCTAFEHTSVRDGDTSIREEDVELAIQGERFVDHALDVDFFACVHLTGVDIDARVQSVDLPLVRLKVLDLVVADEDCFGTITSVLVC